MERLALIENAVQDAYRRALEHWWAAGPLEGPGRWLVRVAPRAMVETPRHERPTGLLDTRPAVPVDPAASDGDDELRLTFLCCDPVLPRAAQVILVWNIAFSLNTRPIATAFVSDERTVAQRMARAQP